MYQDATDTDLDLRKIMNSVARLNPHVSLSDIAYLMDIPYECEPGEFEPGEFKSLDSTKTF